MLVVGGVFRHWCRKLTYNPPVGFSTVMWHLFANRSQSGIWVGLYKCELLSAWAFGTPLFGDIYAGVLGAPSL